jgi:hypothetical protein
VLLNRSSEYVVQSTHRLCEQLNAAAVPTLRSGLADQHATFSGVRVNINLTESFLETCFKAVLKQKRGYGFA